MRKKKLDINNGISTLKFTDLSPYLDPQSIQIKTNDKITILSVKHQYNYIDSAARSQELKKLDNQYKVIDDKLKIENANISIIYEELTFLKENRNIGGKNQEVSLTNLKETSNFYKEKMTSLMMSQIEVNKKIENLYNERSAIEKQRNEINYNQKLPISEIIVKIDAKNQTQCEVELSYFVTKASWYPIYDIRANSIDKPLEIVYKANINQNTQEDWKNVKLKLSSSDPNLGGVAPKLQTYFLNYYTPYSYNNNNNNSYNYSTPNYNNGSGVLKGKILDASTKEPIPYASIVIEKGGKQISGTAGDNNGEFTIKPIPPGTYDLRVTDIAHNTTLTTNIVISPDKITYHDINLTPKTNNLSTVEVVQYKVPLIMKDQTSTGQTITSEEISKMPRRDAGSITSTTGGSFSTSTYNPSKISGTFLNSGSTTVPIILKDNRTSFEFEIKLPYTINSDNKTTSVDIDVYQVKTEYEYYCVPKIDNDAFLIANIVDWEKYNLLEGEANIYFENTYIGKSFLDVRNISDTLSISLGRDKNLVIKREKIKEYTTKQFLGSKKEEIRAWKISVKNNKMLPVNLTIFDQIPIPSIDEIEVNVENISGGDYNKVNGEVKWKFNLEQSGKKDIEFKYKVKYPKDKILTIE